MGNTVLCLFHKDNRATDLNEIHTIDQFEKFVQTNRMKLHQQMLQEAKGLKIFIAQRPCEYDETDPDMIEQFKTDYILSHYKHQYYVAEITFERTAYWPSFADALWNQVETVMSYTFNIYCLDRTHPNFKCRVISKYFTPPRNERGHPCRMTDDLPPLVKVMKTLTAAVIEDRVLSDLRSNEKRHMYAEANKDQNLNNFYLFGGATKHSVVVEADVNVEPSTKEEDTVPLIGNSDL